MPLEITPELVANYGALIVFFAVGISLMLYYVFRILPDDRNYQRESNQLLFEQIALGRQALETANSVITTNSDEMKETRASHKRLGERMEDLTHCFQSHDARAIDIAQDVAVIKSSIAE